jgi:hypothetical protein
VSLALLFPRNTFFTTAGPQTCELYTVVDGVAYKSAVSDVRYKSAVNDVRYKSAVDDVVYFTTVDTEV